MRRHVYFYTYLDYGFEAAAGVLRDDPAGWLPPPAEPVPDAQAWVVDLTAEGALPRAVATLPAVIRVEQPVALGEHLVLGLRWEAQTARRLFPVLEADLELQRLYEAGSKLSLRGTYRPPLSVVGDAGDHLLGHRVAEACVRRFLLDIAEGLPLPA